MSVRKPTPDDGPKEVLEEIAEALTESSEDTLRRIAGENVELRDEVRTLEARCLNYAKELGTADRRWKIVRETAKRTVREAVITIENAEVHGQWHKMLGPSQAIVILGAMLETMDELQSGRFDCP